MATDDQSGGTARLAHAERLASVGLLTAGVAHEINNVLAFLSANLEFVGEELRRIRTGPNGNVPMAEQALTDAREGADRLRRIVRDLRSLSRKAKEESSLVAINRILQLAVNMSSAEIRHRAQLVKSYGDVPSVEGDEGRLIQVFVNLIVNAAQSIEEGRADKHQIHVSTSTTAAGEVCIEIRDTGQGIPPETLGQIFSPFFTTKATGTGLGLAISQEIVADHGGRLEVESEVGRGSCFRVLLPATALERPPTPVEGMPPLGSGEIPRGRVLVVDDEPLLCSSIRRLLEPRQEVLVATSGKQAFDLLVAGERFDVILCDLMMPVVTGMELYEVVARMSREQAERMVFMTAGTFTPTAREFLERVKNPRLEKPFRAEHLLAFFRTRIST